jgi:FGGY-family pentulose kinase
VPAPPAADLVAAVDVGTGSARAGIFDAAGRLLGRAEAPIDTYAPAPGQFEQDSTQIWQAAAQAVRSARAEAAADPARVAALAFDATCSLVVRDARGRPVTVSGSGDDRRDTILWLDHRALDEADACTGTGHPALEHLGGAMSPEMAPPKLLWLKRHLPGSWARAGRILDLTDFLAWSATGSNARSLCTLACKWAFISGDVSGPQPGFLEAIGLADLPERAGLPGSATPVAADLGPLTPEAAAELGLTGATRVATGLIDAHAGALGVLGHLAGEPAEAERHLALIAGTSSCLMAFARAPRRIPGLWGPHPDAALPGLWLTEGGQSVSGALLDHLIRTRGLDPGPAEHARIAARIAELRRADPDLAPRLHVLPDFHGRRGPAADPRALGAVSGLDLDPSFDGLCRLYFRTAVGLALGLRQVLERLAGHGPAPLALHAAGGHARNPLLMEIYADATGLPVVEPATDAVLLGTAMAAAAGGGLHPSLAAAGAAMARGGTTRPPNPAAAGRYERDWRALLAMQQHRGEIEAGATAGRVL